MSSGNNILAIASLLEDVPENYDLLDVVFCHLPNFDPEDFWIDAHWCEYTGARSELEANIIERKQVHCFQQIVESLRASVLNLRNPGVGPLAAFPRDSVRASIYVASSSS